MPDVIENETCPFCHKKTLTLMEDTMDIPYFGKIFLMSMNCSNCNFNKSDVESEEFRDPCKLTFTIESEEDLKVRVVKGSEANINIPQLKMSVESGPNSNGYVSNIEGLLSRFKHILEEQRDNADEDDVRKKAKSLLKRLWKVECGDEPLKIIIEDQTGNSAIISDKTIVEKLKVSTKLKKK